MEWRRRLATAGLEMTGFFEAGVKDLGKLLLEGPEADEIVDELDNKDLIEVRVPNVPPET